MRVAHAGKELSCILAHPLHPTLFIGTVRYLAYGEDATDATALTAVGAAGYFVRICL